MARRFGFEGGLVPGVTVFGYLTWPAVAEWGRAWLESGTITARFAAPVYDGDHVEVVGAWQGGDLQITACTRGWGARHCSGGAARSDRPSRSRSPTSRVIRFRRPTRGRRRAPRSSARITLGVVERTWHAELAGEYLDLVSDDLAVYRDPPVAHPGWLLRAANYVLSRSVRLGPWIHVESEVRNHSVVTDGEVVATRGRVVDLFERGGHRFVALDVLTSVGDRPVTSVRHTAIYEPRQVRDAPAARD